MDLFTELGARLWEEMRGKKDRLEAACEQLDNAGINVKRGLYEEGRVLVDEINRLAARKPVNAVDARKPITTFTGALAYPVLRKDIRRRLSEAWSKKYGKPRR